jgi:nucleotide-binding universal stress UspA family protein
MIRTILVPQGNSETSGKAIRYAIEIAKGMNTTIKMVRVVPEVVDISNMSHWSPTERKRVKESIDLYKKNIREQEGKKLERYLSRINLEGVKASAMVIEGVDTADTIAKLIRQEKPYLVVIASTKLKLRGLARLKMLGSITRKLSEESESPILIVK